MTENDNVEEVWSFNLKKLLVEEVWSLELFILYQLQSKDALFKGICSTLVFLSTYVPWSGCPSVCPMSVDDLKKKLSRKLGDPEM